MNHLNHSHTSELFDPQQAGPVTVLGAGSVGSQAVLMLARMGVSRIALYDADDVRSHNLPMTMTFGIKDLGRYKVDVVREKALAETGVEVQAHRQMYDGQSLSGSVLCCVDSMEARMAAWNAAKMNPSVDIFVDTRTHKRFLSIFAVRPCLPEDISLYESRLYPSSQTLRPMCGSHGILYISATAAALAVRALTGFWSGDIPPLHESVLFSQQGVRAYQEEP